MKPIAKVFASLFGSEQYDPETPGGMNMPWKSCYFMESPDKVVLHEGGYLAWPFAFGRFITTFFWCEQASNTGKVNPTKCQC